VTATTGTGPLAAAAEALAGLDCASLDAPATLAALTAVRRLAADAERAELALSQAARGGGATWSQIAAAMGARGRQGAQKRHADLSRRYPRPPVVDTAPPAAPAPERAPISPRAAVKPSRAARAGASHATGSGTSRPAPERALRHARRSARPPKVTPGVIGEGRYELVRAPDWADSRAWHVMVGGKRAGTVRPTWRGEGTRHGWEAVHPSGTVLPATGTGRVTAAGNARTRDAAAVSLLNVLLREQGRR
jgi:hypothetical protein